MELIDKNIQQHGPYLGEQINKRRALTATSFDFVKQVHLAFIPLQCNDYSIQLKNTGQSNLILNFYSLKQIG